MKDTFTVSLAGNQVSDAHGNTAAAATLGTFNVDITVATPLYYMDLAGTVAKGGHVGAAALPTVFATTPIKATTHVVKHHVKGTTQHNKPVTTKKPHAHKGHRKPLPVIKRLRNIR